MHNISKKTEKTQSYDQYLQYIADLDMSSKEKFELLYIVNSILSHFVDQAFYVQTDQITLGSLGKLSSNAPPGHVMIRCDPENYTADARNNGAESDFNPLGTSEQ